MNALDVRVAMILDEVDMEFRTPILTALRYSDGTVLSFSQELAAQTWENPELPVQDILDKLLYDLA